jgi:hypothetical protein
MVENIGASSVHFTASEVAKLNRLVSAIRVRGARLPEAVQIFSGVEAPSKSRSLLETWSRNASNRAGVGRGSAAIIYLVRILSIAAL